MKKTENSSMVVGPLGYEFYRRKLEWMEVVECAILDIVAILWVDEIGRRKHFEASFQKMRSRSWESSVCKVVLTS